jgi:hypothetical protein
VAIDNIIVPFKRRVDFKEHKKNIFGIKIYKLHGSNGYAYDKLYLGKDKQCKAHDLTATHATVTVFTRNVKGCHILYMDNFFSSTDLLDDMIKK